MTLRTALVIDGDARGARQAATDTSDAIRQTQQDAARASRELKDVLDQVGAGGKAANDNIKLGGKEVIDVLERIAGKVFATNEALAKSSAGAATVAKSFLGIVGPVGLVIAGIQLLEGAINLLNQAAARGEREMKARLEEHARLVGVVGAAYSDAERKAGGFLNQSKAVTELQTRQSLLGLGVDLTKQIRVGLGSLAAPRTSLAQLFSYERDLKKEFEPFADAIFKLQDGVASGRPDLRAFQEEVTAIAGAARGTNPELEKTAVVLLALFKGADETAAKAAQAEAMLRLLGGAATDADRKRLGLSASTAASINEFDRATKSLERQAAAQEAEARAVGLSVGAQAKLRAEMLLLEAAKQADLKVDEKRLAAIDALAGRIGAAAQKAAELRLQSDAMFERTQIGRTPIEASVAAQLRGVYGDLYAGQMDGVIANQLRFNEQLRLTRDLVGEGLSGIIRETRAEIANGTNAWDAFQNAGLNALSRLSDKLTDMALQNLVAKAFGGASSSAGLLSLLFGGGASIADPTFGGFSLAGTSAAAVKFDVGGYTGNMARHKIAGVVHGQEFVINADATAKHLPLLQAINDNRVPGYARGGYVGSLALAPNGAAPASAPVINIYPAAPGETFRAEQNPDGSLALIGEMVDQRLDAFSRQRLPSLVHAIAADPEAR